MKRQFAAIFLAALVAACATATRATLENRFEAIGVPPSTAVCMVDDLDRRLTDQELRALARHTFEVSRADTTLGAIRALMRIDDPRIVAAVGQAGVSCVTGFAL